MTDFASAAAIGGLLAKDYARDLLTLLVMYRDISASEAASRLNLHISTAQDYLDALTGLGVVTKVEARENKRPYFRYRLAKDRIQVDLDLNGLAQAQPDGALSQRIRERNNSGARFVAGRGDGHIHHVSIWSGEGRERSEKQIQLTLPQGKFLYQLPFPTAEPLMVSEIMRKAEVEHTLAPEILDLVKLLNDCGVIQVLAP